MCSLSGHVPSHWAVFYIKAHNKRWDTERADRVWAYLIKRQAQGR